jgi:hypothetical protein
MNRVKYFSNSSLSLKVYPITFGSSESGTLCGWAINASLPADSLTISMMTMSQTYAPG